VAACFQHGDELSVSVKKKKKKKKKKWGNSLLGE
jgi:hypothetical protein